MINDPRQVLLPVDGSESSKRAMSWYMANIFRPSDVIHLYHICEPSYAANNFSLTTLGQSKTNEINAMLQEHIELSNTLSHDFLSRLESRGVSGDFTLTVGTKPGEMIVSQARDLNADLIVMGSRGRYGGAGKVPSVPLTKRMMLSALPFARDSENRW
ncbi:Universal stress protein G [Echinococcus granulosus]|uniref:Universal stress protein G n=1 Tax=Echinococcus granulosus TaxID=6210 RepID=W6UMJ4_ECHGR|nr:Universal stress protein G [Echinococcus granulosus]EUB62283.1 Universal stress protein G [Echinococcus granulosus]